ncbi:MAG: carbohydrate ABC transporter permease [Chloroflexota bacterium]|nr:carbohydrate ABC transporter permease [Chloroflexota bacterium]MDE2910572.1 carbohydrate ABC transporter permease [Chloroflexota bacterium]
MTAVGAELQRKRQLLERRRGSVYVLAVGVFALIWMLPVIWTLVTSFRPEAALQRNLASLIPYPFTTENWAFILKSSQLWKWLGNSAFVSTTHTLAQLTVCSLAAYAFARLDFYFKRPLYLLVLIGLMVPFEATFLPVYLLFSNLKLHNTLIALILPGIASSFAVFLLTQFFRGIPLELEEAAMMDGAGRFRIFLIVIVPLSTPVITALAIFTFLGNWNSYLWPIISATSSEVYTIVIGLRKLNQAWGDVNFYGRDMAAAVFTALPIIIFFFVFQRRIISGIAINSGIK